MKRFVSSLVLAVLTVSASAQAAQPNHYVCQNEEEGVSVMYDTTSVSGQSVLNIRIADEQILPVDQEQFRVSMRFDRTAFGELVTAYVSPQYVADVPSKVYGVFIPGIQVYENGEQEAVFQTKLLVGRAGGFLPPNLQYQKINQVIDLECSADLVMSIL